MPSILGPVRSWWKYQVSLVRPKPAPPAPGLTALEQRLALRVEPRLKVERHEPTCAHDIDALPEHYSARLRIHFRECPDCGMVVGRAA